MAQGVKQKNSADLVAGIIVLIVALGLLAAVVIAVKQLTSRLPEPTQGTTMTTTPTTAPTQPPEPTLAPNPFGQDAFLYDDDGYLTCLTAESWLGIDVSEHQGSVQWDQVAASPVEFAMIRMGYRGWGAEGVMRPDARGQENLQGAKEVGLKVGVYFFSQATSVEEAVEEAHFLLELLNGQPLDLPVVFDWETVSNEDARTANMDKETLNACALAFCREIRQAGYDAMVYFNLHLAKGMFDLLTLQQADLDFWLAMYHDTFGYAYAVQMWQYSDNGSVPGIKGRVDMNLYFPGG